MVEHPPYAIKSQIMASRQDNLDDFEESQKDFADWPTNLLSTSQFEHDLEQCQKKLASLAPRSLFHPAQRSVQLLDYSETHNCKLKRPTISAVS